MAKKDASKARPTLSGQIRDVIAARGLNLSELGQLSGVDSSVIGRFVSGERELRTGTLDKIAGALDLRLVEVAPPKGRAPKRSASPSGRK
jgi:transcriptional regulator with XRE-family HTH domain